MLAHFNATRIDHAWILLDSQSTFSAFNNKAMLSNIRASMWHVLHALANKGGHQDSGMVGDFKNLGAV